VRWAFLLIVLAWLGWFAGAQLSVVNVLTFVHSLMTGFQWEFFLLDPLIFILWSYVAVALLFLGRGVFCGWLCPFGALQELLNEGARRLRLPQYRVPFALHERLWPIKYLAFLGLFAVSLNSMTAAFIGAEIEPFKTAISLRFQREWPFVVYAVGLLAAGLFIERFFCRYLCPLGAALAIPARLRMFEWLKRHPQCGRECQICFRSCPVQAIHPEGPINPNECIHCLTCQTLYTDDTICPPLVAQRKRRERRDALAAGRPVTSGGGPQ
jgi:polyferredoxin